ncbi:MAG: hypothetical protein JWO80_6533, partial [Bryobacterales bacterium]|nr:hypothetical protein [Bryobacterales bacterium]
HNNPVSRKDERRGLKVSGFSSVSGGSSDRCRRHRVRAIILRQHNPTDDVCQQTGTGKKNSGKPDDADQRDVQIQITRKGGANAADALLVHGPAQRTAQRTALGARSCRVTCSLLSHCLSAGRTEQGPIGKRRTASSAIHDTRSYVRAK